MEPSLFHSRVHQLKRLIKEAARLEYELEGVSKTELLDQRARYEELQQQIRELAKELAENSALEVPEEFWNMATVYQQFLLRFAHGFSVHMSEGVLSEARDNMKSALILTTELLYTLLVDNEHLGVEFVKEVLNCLRQLKMPSEARLDLQQSLLNRLYPNRYRNGRRARTQSIQRDEVQRSPGYYHPIPTEIPEERRRRRREVQRRGTNPNVAVNSVYLTTNMNELFTIHQGDTNGTTNPVPAVSNETGDGETYGP